MVTGQVEMKINNSQEIQTSKQNITRDIEIQNKLTVTRGEKGEK